MQDDSVTGRQADGCVRRINTCLAAAHRGERGVNGAGGERVKRRRDECLPSVMSSHDEEVSRGGEERSVMDEPGPRRRGHLPALPPRRPLTGLLALQQGVEPPELRDLTEKSSRRGGSLKEACFPCDTETIKRLRWRLEMIHVICESSGGERREPGSSRPRSISPGSEPLSTLSSSSALHTDSSRQEKHLKPEERLEEAAGSTRGQRDEQRGTTREGRLERDDQRGTNREGRLERDDRRGTTGEGRLERDDREGRLERDD
ncbi:unnamed protein product [Pleuronectes platessa]|uniref:Uncharacterized protein n=1 Tax=Pleuronectes platessa TaxID=8262 RepID=A0A9N7UBS6_PLEPL|nr:unnamed protein product [Pleuronectes platessa]